MNNRTLVYFGLAAGIVLVGASCQSGGPGVVEKVRYDFGIGERPEGYESLSDRVMERLDAVGKTEMKRMNVAGRYGDIQFIEESSLRGKYFKQVKVYESYLPLEAVAVSRGSQGERGFVGYVQYTYRIMQGEHAATKTEAEASSANVSTDVTGRETYRYTFGPGGTWDSAPGEQSSR